MAKPVTESRRLFQAMIEGLPEFQEFIDRMVEFHIRLRTMTLAPPDMFRLHGTIDYAFTNIPAVLGDAQWHWLATKLAVHNERLFGPHAIKHDSLVLTSHYRRSEELGPCEMCAVHASLMCWRGLAKLQAEEIATPAPQLLKALQTIDSPENDTVQTILASQGITENYADHFAEIVDEVIFDRGRISISFHIPIEQRAANLRFWSAILANDFLVNAVQETCNTWLLIYSSTHSDIEASAMREEYLEVMMSYPPIRRIYFAAIPRFIRLLASARLFATAPDIQSDCATQIEPPSTL